MAQFTVNSYRRDPYKNFKFRVIIEGMPVAGISKISALKRTTEVASFRPGSDSDISHLSPGTTSYAPITLERGITHDTTFESWAEQVFSLRGDSERSLANYKKDIIIELLNLQGVVVIRYMVRQCWISEYQALPELDAEGSCVAIERIVLRHEGWERDRDTHEPTQS